MSALPDDSGDEQMMDVQQAHEPPKTSSPSSEEDSDSAMSDVDAGELCDVCAEGDIYENSPLVQCASCGVAVHPLCYGTPLTSHVPAVWHCERCLWNASSEPCVLCPQRHGAMKRTTDYRWAHLSCAMWVPEVFFRDGDGREPVDCLQVSRRRFQQLCVHCGQREGACITCSQHRCKTTFHVTCGMQNDIYLEYRENLAGGADVCLSFCKKHAKMWTEGKKRKSVVIPTQTD